MLLNIENQLSSLANIMTIIAFLWASYIFYKSRLSVNLIRIRKKVLTGQLMDIIKHATKENNITRKALNKKMARRVHEQVKNGIVFELSDEIDWLSNIMNIDDSITFYLNNTDLHKLSKSYAHMAVKLDNLNILVSGMSIIESEADLNRKVSEYLENHATNKSSSDSKKNVERYTVNLHGDFNKLIFNNPTNHLANKSIFRLMISWRKKVYIFNDGKQAEYSEHKFKRKELKGENTFLYDGILPAMLRFRTEHDLRDGTPYLHLSLADTTYSSIVSLRKTKEGEFSDMPRALTLSALLISKDGYIIYNVRSSETDSYQDKISPGVNGNLDMPLKSYTNKDIDSYGIASPIKAIMREAYEELHLIVKEEEVSVHGIGEIWAPDDKGTFILGTSILSHRTKLEIEDEIKFADPITGGWESSESVLSFAVPKTEEEALSLLDDLLADKRGLQPHALFVTVEYLIFVKLIKYEDLNSKIDNLKNKKDKFDS